MAPKSIFILFLPLHSILRVTYLMLVRYMPMYNDKEKVKTNKRTGTNC